MQWSDLSAESIAQELTFFKPQFLRLASANSAIEQTESTWNPRAGFRVPGTWAFTLSRPSRRERLDRSTQVPGAEVRKEVHKQGLAT